MEKTPVIIILLFSIGMTFPSCTGQGYTDTAQTQINQKPTGKIVAELDPKATLIFQDKRNNYWFGSKENGVYKYDGKSLVLYSSKDGLCGYSVLDAQEDKSGNIYFDTPQGVCKFDGRQFTTLKVTEGNTVKNEWKSEPDDLWFRMGWDSNGPYRFDGKNLYHLEFPKNKMEDEFRAKYPNIGYNPYGIYYIYKDRSGNLWFGTSSLGIYRFDGKKVSWMYEQHLTDTPEGGSFGIRSITEDKDGYIWICNSNFKFKILPDSVEGINPVPLNYTKENGLEDFNNKVQYFMSMITDKNGDLWMANEKGAWRYTGKELYHYPVRDGDSNVFLFKIYEDNQGVLWAGTFDNGIYRFNGKVFEKFRID
ncbi:MAG: hypothetical protein IPK76_11545 [Lewinellaceae bacterium]|nr:hypothetical protein [Lewinellaceae bacterium]